MDRLDLYFRAHTVPLENQPEDCNPGPTADHEPDQAQPQPKPSSTPTGWQEHVLIFHCLNTADEAQEPLAGAYICAQLENGKYVPKEVGLFCPEDHKAALRVLKRFVRGSSFELGTLETFRRKVFLKYLKTDALICGYDMPAQISRIAVVWNKSQKWRRAFSFYFRVFRDKNTRKIRPSAFEPGLSIESLDASKAIYRLIKYKFHGKDRDEEEEQAARPRILDLKTLTSVLTGDVYTLSSACDVFGVPRSRKRQLRPRVTKSMLEHLLKTVTAELELLNREKETFDGHMLGVAPETCFSPASVAKLCFRNMGIEPPQEKFRIPDKINGIAMQALHAGRAECTIRNTPLPITYVDFHAQFPAVSKLVGCSEILCAERLEFPDFTAQAGDIVENATLDKCFDPAFWKQPWFALVEPEGDVLPLRAKFGQDSDPILGWNYVSSKQPFWVTGLDVIASKILTGKSPKILKAILVQPRGIQAGLVPIKLYNQLQVDPLRDDLSVKLVQLRSQIKPREPHLAGGLKVAANSAAFGLFCQLDVRDLEKPLPLRIFSGEAEFTSPPKKVYEQPAEYYCPILASLVTGGSHLLCAMLERMVHDKGGHIAAMDTDSAMIVSTKNGELVPCAGGPRNCKKYTPLGGHSAVKALSFAEVEEIRQRFESLNPWRDIPGVPFLKLEPENFGPKNTRQQLYAFCIASKLYALYNFDDDHLVIRKPSGHGLGYLEAPYAAADWERRTGHKWNHRLPPWIFEAWHFILSRKLELASRPPMWLTDPAVMIVPISTPQALAKLGNFRTLRPFNSVMVPFPHKQPDVLWKGCFVMPYRSKLNDLHGRPLVNIVSGGTFYIHHRQSPKPLSWLTLRAMKDEISHILSRSESKFCTPNGRPCTNNTSGVLVRRHLVAGEFHYVGKEASTRWGSGPDLSMMADAGALNEVDETSREYERVLDLSYLHDIRTQAKQFSTKALFRQSGVAECAIRAFRNGRNSVRPRTLRKLTRAIHDLQNRII